MRGHIRVRTGAHHVRNLTIQALMADGWITAPTTAHWNVAGTCKRPVQLALEGIGPRPEHVGCVTGAPFGRHLEVAARVKVLRAHEPDRDLHMLVPCRQCSACLASRAYRWGARAVREWEAAPRTWFGTLTFSPETRYAVTAETELRLADTGASPLGALTRSERFRELSRTVSPLLTKYLWALRDGRKAGRVLVRNTARGVKREQVACPPLRYRYLITAEPHQDGFPHLHMLLHELAGAVPATERQLRVMWPHGFPKWSLVQEERAARYAAKYLSKWSVARVRASGHYGETSESASKSVSGISQITTDSVSSFDTGNRENIDPPKTDGSALASVAFMGTGQ